MKKIYSIFKLQIFALLILTSTALSAQVGIGTTSPNADALLDIDASTNVGGLLLPRVSLTQTTNFAPLTAHVQGMSVYNTATANDVTPGQYYNDGTKWVRVEESTLIDSISLNSDLILNSVNFSNISGMLLTFTAKKTSVLVTLTASGIGYTNSLGTIELRVRNTTDNYILGGTNTKIQSLYDTFLSSYSVTTWSCSFSKLMTGLTVGNTYSLRVQSSANAIYGTRGAAIYPISAPDTNHLTLSVTQ
ncbi:hypothetical protein [Xanthomarina spongicola]|uniref:Uncharacterized protein n=1 Tax=Xanthomarina spongicola TaxID=570520 RepID=A0A316DI91_9FLAO|nr:hypothetical protein [Xanthomarina spongicola]PWK17396.1 hypothetical protein LX78_02729 [Xanthomarina spongicola]